MDIMDKTLPTLPAIPTEWAHDAVARATHALEPLAEPFLGRRNRGSRWTTAFSRNRIAIGATVIVLAGIAVLSLRDHRTKDSAAQESTEPQKMRSVA